MTAPTPSARALRLAALTAALGTSLLAGCGREAGSQINTANFGSATMNNHLVQSCEAGPVSAGGKYRAPAAGCPGRTLDGRYAQAVYDNYVADAVPIPQVVRTFAD